jgi:sugar O-acyltransferase (sialic acid O-acetyltransferase NeuD family)
MKKLLIFPFNGNGLEALDAVKGNFDFIGFVDDTVEKQGKNKNGFHVFSREAFIDYPDALVLAVPGSPTSYTFRDKIISELNIDPARFATVIHPRAVVSPLAQIGKNVLVMAGVVLTANCAIGSHVCILPNTVIHHDVSIAEFTLVGSNVTIAGNVKIGRKCYIGSGTSIMNGINLGDEVLVGMGSNVIRAVSHKSKVAGNPAKPL